MSVTEIIEGIKQLNSHELELFYRQLGEIEGPDFEQELAAARAEVARRGLTEEDVDRAIWKRRYGNTNP